MNYKELGTPYGSEVPNPKNEKTNSCTNSSALFLKRKPLSKAFSGEVSPTSWKPQLLQHRRLL